MGTYSGPACAGLMLKVVAVPSAHTKHARLPLRTVIVSVVNVAAAGVQVEPHSNSKPPLKSRLGAPPPVPDVADVDSWELPIAVVVASAVLAWVSLELPTLELDPLTLAPTVPVAVAPPLATNSSVHPTSRAMAKLRVCENNRTTAQSKLNLGEDQVAVLVCWTNPRTISGVMRSRPRHLSPTTANHTTAHIGAMNMDEIAKRFEDAQRRVKELKSSPSNDDLLSLYALFKQATAGDATGSRPGMLDVKGRAKFDAWSKRKGMAKSDAMTQYVALVDRLVN